VSLLRRIQGEEEDIDDRLGQVRLRLVRVNVVLLVFPQGGVFLRVRPTGPGSGPDRFS
jgi:hypothetical protein